MTRKKIRRRTDAKEQNNRGQQPFTTGRETGHPSTMEEESLRLREEWRVVFNSVAESRGLSLPQSFVNYVVARELSDFRVLQLPPQLQDDLVGEAVNNAFAAYLALLARAMELVTLDVPCTADTSAAIPVMLVHALYEAVDECEQALGQPPLGTDLFADAVWPATKRRLVSWLEADGTGTDYFYRRQLEARRQPARLAVPSDGS